MKRIHFFLLFLFVASQTPAQITLKGIITEGINGKTLPGAVITCPGTQLGTISDNAGIFSLLLPAGENQLRISYIGYVTEYNSYIISKDTLLNIVLKPDGILTSEITVAATRAGSGTMPVSTLSKDEIQSLNTGQDVPYLLQNLPSVVVTSDAGNGIGYTGIRIRGTDQSRINVTINGIPLNDAESQQVYWVDLPDFASSTDNIQVQRGAGSSTNGSGAFGGTINLLSKDASEEPYAELTSGYGTFNTFRNTAGFATGRMQNKFSLEGRLSKITSDGYIDRGSSDLKSYYLGGSYADQKNLVRLNVFGGKEITYQSWNGVPESRYNGDQEGMQQFIQRNYLDEEDAHNLLNSGRNYNYYTYENQVDDYQQQHYQLHYARTLNNKTSVNIALHYTKGEGFYEEYKKSQELSDYGLAPVVTPTDTISASNLVRRKWLDNDFYGVVFGLTSQLSDDLQLIAGGSVNRYDGLHFGEVTWTQYAFNTEDHHRYYEDEAIKDDRTVYAKVNYSLHKKISLFGDLQYRTVSYDFIGLSTEGDALPSTINHEFFNPKAGISWFPGEGQEVYTSVSVANKEPNRDDYVISTPESRPKAENLVDFEAGYRYNRKRTRLNLNAYYMNYKDQLVLTGAVNDVGNYTRVNIDKSYRMGMEAEAGVAITKQFAFDVNITLSKNRIAEFNEYNDAYDISGNYTGQQAVKYKDTPIAFSPEITSSGRLSWKYKEHLTVMLIGRYIGEQFMDNSGQENRMLDDYLVADFRLEYIIKLKPLKELRFNLLVNNLLSTEYASNGYTYGYVYDTERITENFYYPQALINYMAQVTFRF